MKLLLLLLVGVAWVAAQYQPEAPEEQTPRIKQLMATIHDRLKQEIHTLSDQPQQRSSSIMFSESPCAEGQYRDSDEQCLECPVGSFSNNDLPGEICLKCPIGSFSDLTGATDCQSCHPSEDNDGMEDFDSKEDWDRYVTQEIGATSKEDCFDLMDLLGNTETGRYDVEIDVAISGVDNMCSPGMKKVLAGVTELAVWGFRVTNCDYDNDDDTTMMSFVVSPPAAFAFELYRGLSYVEAMIDWVNGFIFESGFLKEMLQMVAGLATDIGLVIGIDMLDIDDFRVERFQVRLSSQNLVEKSGEFYEVSIDGFKCEENHEMFDAKWRIMESDMFGCAKESSGCRIHVDTCNDAGNSVAVATVHVIGATTVSEGRTYDSNKGFYNDEYFSLVAARSTCPQGKSCEKCEPGWILGQSGECGPCPFSTFGEDMGDYTLCISCPYRHTTPFWGMTSPDHCLGPDNDYDMYYAGNLALSIDVKPQIDMCELREAKWKIDETCNEAKSSGDAVTSFLCELSMMITRGRYDTECGTRVEREWQDSLIAALDSGETMDLMCFAMRHFVKDEKRPCDDTWRADPMEMLMSFPSITMGFEGSDILVPLFTGAMKTVTMDFSSMSEMMDDMMENIGILDMTTFTGIQIANNLMDVERAVMRGLRVAQLDFEPTYDEKEYFCESMEPKYDCSNKMCHWYSQCPHPESDDSKKITCDFDECNSCELIQFFDTEYRQEYECLPCYFPELAEGSRTEIMDYDGKTRYNYKCDEGFMLSQDTCGFETRCDKRAQIENIQVCVPDTCSELLEITITAGRLIETWKDGTNENEYKFNSCPWAQFQCNQTHFFRQGQSTLYCSEYGLTRLPVCDHISSCPFAIEGGIVTGTFMSESGEPMAEYSCDDMYHYVRGDSYCKYDRRFGEYEVGKMMCVPADTCAFPDAIRGGSKVDEYEDEAEGKRYARYKCDDGYYGEGSDLSSCDKETGTIADIEYRCIDNTFVCDYQTWFTDGQLEFDRDSNGAYWYSCEFPYFLKEGDGRAECEEYGMITYPTCERRDNTCQLWDNIDNGTVVDLSYNRLKYSCNVWAFYRLPEGHNGWAYCEGDQVANMPVCEKQVCEFKNTIDNGELQIGYEHNAEYSCNPGYRFMDDERYAECKLHRMDDEVRVHYVYPECVEDKGPCNFPATLWGDGVKTGELVDLYDYAARYECFAGNMMLGEEWVTCKGEDDFSDMPICKTMKDCKYDMSDNLIVSYKSDEEAYFVCKAGFTLIGNNPVMCNLETGEPTSSMPYCKPDNKCKLPEFIRGGYLSSRDPVNQTIAYYTCYAGFSLNMNRDLLMGAYEHFKKNNQSGGKERWFRDAYSWAAAAGHCTKEGYLMLPACQPIQEGAHCELPMVIEYGYMIEVTKPEYPSKDDEMRFWSMTEAVYECQYGMNMLETMHGNEGWCRSDGSYEVPMCYDPGYMETIEFKLGELERAKSLVKKGKGGKDDTIMGGVVMARTLDGDGNEKEGWKLACNRNINENMAGAVCRAVNGGYFTGGVIYNAKEKLLDEIAENYTFGWINAECDYDDTLPMSPHCRAQKYEDYNGICFPDDIAVVRCFNVKMTAEVEIMESKKKQFRCALTLLREDQNMLKKLIRNKAVPWDERVHVHMEIDGEPIEGKLGYKRGYFWREWDSASSDFGCAVCEVMIDGRDIAMEKFCPDRK